MNIRMVITRSIILLGRALCYRSPLIWLLKGACFVPITSTNLASFTVANFKDFLPDFRETSSQGLAVSHLLEVCYVTWLIENFLRLEMLKFVFLVKHIITTNPSLFFFHFFAVRLLRVLKIESVNNFFFYTDVEDWFFINKKTIISSGFQIYFTIRSS